MHKIGTILLLCPFLLLVVPIDRLEAQDQRIGFIDSDLVIEKMPEYAGIEQRLQLLSESWREELDELDREIVRMREEFEAREVLFTDEMRQQRLEEIEDLREDRERFLHEKFGPEGEYFQRQKELLEPIQRQIFDAVSRVADREGFDFVFDRSEDPRLLFASPEWNLTEEVLIELGLDVDP